MVAHASIARHDPGSAGRREPPRSGPTAAGCASSRSACRIGSSVSFGINASASVSASALSAGGVVGTHRPARRTRCGARPSRRVTPQPRWCRRRPSSAQLFQRSIQPHAAPNRDRRCERAWSVRRGATTAPAANRSASTVMPCSGSNGPSWAAARPADRHDDALAAAGTAYVGGEVGAKFADCYRIPIMCTAVYTHAFVAESVGARTVWP